MIRGFDELTNRKARVFISSTFLDMGAERDAIVHRIFPALRRYFEPKKIDIVEIDLRWGILDEEILDGNLIEVCISEVRRCAPFFLGIIGSHYGSVPSDDDIDSTNDYILNMISDDMPYGISITEMEMRAGILHRKRQQASVLIKNVEKENRLNLLIDALKDSNKCELLAYNDINEFADLVFQTMKSHIEKIFYANLPQVSDDERYYDHLNFLKIHLDHYVENTSTVSMAESFIEDSDFCYIQGTSGIGKSAFLSYLIKHFDETCPQSLLFFHFLQADMNENINCFWKRLSAFLIDKGLMNHPDIENLVQDTKEALLSYDDIKNPLFIFVDDIDKFDGNKNYAYELQSLSSESVKIILTGTKPASSGLASFSLHPLLKAQIPQLFVKWFAQYDKKFDTFFLPKLENNQIFRNPMNLSFALNELRIMGVHNGLQNYLESLLSCSTENDMFAETINCAVNAVGNKELLRDCLTIPLLCKNGIGENDIINVLGISHVSWVTVYGLIQGFFCEFDGNIKFRNEKLAKAVLGTIELTKEKESKFRGALLDYWLQSVDSDRRRRELPWQAYHLGEVELLAKYFSAHDNILWSFKNDLSSLSRYLHYLQSKNLFVDLEALSAAFSRNGDLDQLFETLLWSRCYAEIPKLYKLVDEKALGIIAKRCNARALFKQAESKYKPALKAFQSILSEYPFIDESTNDIKLLYAVALCEAGDFEASYRIVNEVINFYEKNGITTFYSSYAVAYLANIQYTYGELKNALVSANKAVKLREKLYGTNSIEVAWIYCFVIPILFANGRVKDAMDKADVAIQIYSSYFGNVGVEYAWSASIVANCHLLNKEYDRAIKLFEKSIEQNDMVIDAVSRPHPYSLTSYNSLAVIEWLNGNKDKAIDDIKQTIKWKKQRLQPDHSFTANSIVNLAIMIGEMDPHEGLRLLNEADRIYGKSFSSEHPDRQFVELCRAAFLSSLGETEKSKEILGKYNPATSESKQIAEIYAMLHDDPKECNMECYWTSNNLCELLIIPKLLSFGK